MIIFNQYKSYILHKLSKIKYNNYINFHFPRKKKKKVSLYLISNNIIQNKQAMVSLHHK